jgi:toxin ParE1/3/4
MAQPNFVLTDRAREDLLAIEAYIADRDSELRAQTIIVRILGLLARLAYNPLIGRRRDDLPGEPLSFPIMSWTIFYEPVPEGLRVLRIISGRRDIPNVWDKSSG